MGSPRSEAGVRDAARDPAGANGGEGRLSIRDVGKIYDPEGVHVVALERCSLEIEPGGFVAVVGRRGAARAPC